MSGQVIFRPATPDDIREILHQRRSMYQDMDYKYPDALAGMVSTSEPYLAQAMANGSFKGWLALSDGRIVGGGALIISPWLSHPYDLECRRATILNLYVHPEFRRRGIARRLMQAMIEWCRENRFAAVYLHASEDGRHLYESLGFEPTTEMQLKFRM